MIEINKNKKILKKRSWLLIIILFIIAIILIIATYKVYLKSRNAGIKNENIKVDLEELEERTNLLEEKVKKLQTESGIEEEIREKFNVKKPGEETLTIVDKASEDDKINSNDEQGFFSKIWGFIKSAF